MEQLGSDYNSLAEHRKGNDRCIVTIWEICSPILIVKYSQN